MHGFNANLYIVAATVIPVAFFALMLPPVGVLMRYARWAKRWRSQHAVPIVKAKGSTVRLWLVLRGYDILYIPVTAMVLFTLEGEVRSIKALSAEHASATDQRWVVASLVGTIVIAVLCVMGAISQSWAAGIPRKPAADPHTSSTRPTASITITPDPPPPPAT